MCFMTNKDDGNEEMGFACPFAEEDCLLRVIQTDQISKIHTLLNHKLRTTKHSEWDKFTFMLILNADIPSNVPPLINISL